MLLIILGVLVIAVFGLFAYMKAKTEQRQEERRERLEQKQEELMRLLQQGKGERDKPEEEDVSGQITEKLSSTNVAGTNRQWIRFDDGQSIGTRGSEGGTIIADLECVNGARVTIEQGGLTAPYSVTLGIYGLMFHTHFADTDTDANRYMNFAVKKIDEILLTLYLTPESDRDTIWHRNKERLLNELVQ